MKGEGEPTVSFHQSAFVVAVQALVLDSSTIAQQILEVNIAFARLQLGHLGGEQSRGQLPVGDLVLLAGDGGMTLTALLIIKTIVEIISPNLYSNEVNVPGIEL